MTVRRRLRSTVLALASSLVLVVATGCGGQKAIEAEARAQLEQELEQLRTENAELRRLQVENQELDRLRRDNEELKRLMEETKDLEKLRQENAQLRAELQSLKPVRPTSPLRR